MTEQERWLKVEEIVRRVVEDSVRRIVREELSTVKQQKAKLRLEGGKWIGIAEEQMTAWGAAYPAVNIEKALLESAAWCLSNPMESPRCNFSRFINTWLQRNQNAASLRAIPKPSPMSIPPSLCAYCRRGSIGAVNGFRHCREHTENAMSGEKPQQFMPGVEAKRVAGD